MCVYVQAKHATEGCVSWGVNGENGEIVDMNDYGVWEAYSVKAQTYKTAIEVRLSDLFHFGHYRPQKWQVIVFSHLQICLLLFIFDMTEVLSLRKYIELRKN